MSNTYTNRLIKDLSVTFNHTPLTVKEIARYWKRNAVDVQAAAIKLKRLGKLTFNPKGEMVLIASTT